MKPLLALKAAFVAARAAVKATYTSTTLIFSDWYRGFTAGWGSVAFEKLARLARENAYAGRGLRLIAETMAEVRVTVFRETTDDAGKMAEEEDPRHDVLRLLKRPYLDGRRTTWRRLCDAFVWGIYCGGDLWIEKRGPVTGPNAGRARELHVLRNERFVRLVRDETTDELTGYEFRNRLGKARIIPEADVLHIRTYNPTTYGNGATDDECGLPLLVAARRALAKIEAADEWNRNISRNAGRVPGYFMPQGLDGGKQLKPEDVAAAQEGVDEATVKRRGLNLPQVLSGAFDYRDGSVSPKDADWLKGRNVDAREVAAVLGVPATLLGDEKAGSLTDAGVDSEMAALYKLTVLPLLAWLLEELTLWLLGDDMDERLAFDRDQIEVLQEDMNGMWERYGKAVAIYGILTDDEARQALGYDPLTDEQREQMNRTPTLEPPSEPDASRADAMDEVRKSLRLRFAKGRPALRQAA